MTTQLQISHFVIDNANPLSINRFLTVRINSRKTLKL